MWPFFLQLGGLPRRPQATFSAKNNHPDLRRKGTINKGVNDMGHRHCTGGGGVTRTFTAGLF